MLFAGIAIFSACNGDSDDLKVTFMVQDDATGQWQQDITESINVYARYIPDEVTIVINGELFVPNRKAIDQYFQSLRKFNRCNLRAIQEAIFENHERRRKFNVLYSNSSHR